MNTDEPLSEDAIRQIEQEMHDQAQRAALALADYPELARDVQGLLTDRTEGVTRETLHEWAGIGTVDDYQGRDDNRRERRLAELRLALDHALGTDRPAS